MRIGLRVDVDTFRGTRLGVPALCRILATHGIRATFFFSVGPDNMGRHLWRLARPAFLWKMLRTRAASLFGWDILLRGTFWPGPMIGERLGDVIRDAVRAGHEAGLHAWDHHAWQAHIDSMDGEAIRRHLALAAAALTRLVGAPPSCSAAPGWKCTDTVLAEKGRFAFVYNSDCRGHGIFRPVVAGSAMPQPQIPVTLPTYDEVVAPGRVSPGGYNEYMLSLLDPDRLNVLTVHAEVEGIACAAMFGEFVRAAKDRGAEFVPLRNLLDDCRGIPSGTVVRGSVPGREGWVACQAPGR